MLWLWFLQVRLHPVCVLFLKVWKWSDFQCVLQGWCCTIHENRVETGCSIQLCFICCLGKILIRFIILLLILFCLFFHVSPARQSMIYFVGCCARRNASRSHSKPWREDFSSDSNCFENLILVRERSMYKSFHFLGIKLYILCKHQSWLQFLLSSLNIILCC